MLPQRAEFSEHPPSHELRYELYGPLARGSVSPHFADMTVEYDEEQGIVRVQAFTDDLFKAVRILLSYGSNCKVLEPPEAVRRMREHVAGMARLYKLG